MKKPDPILIFMLACLGWLLVSMLTGCYTEKKARQQIAKADEHYPALLPEIARDKYPCTDLLKPDTLTVYQDSLVYIDCPTTTDIVSFIDTTTIHTPGKTVRVPVTIPVQVRYITKWYEDSAKLKLNALELTASQTKINKLQASLDAMTGSRNWYRRWFWWLIVAVVILGAFSTYKILH